MRDVTLGDTFYYKFTTRRFTTGVPYTLAGASPAVAAYEDDNTTQLTGAGVVELTTDFDSIAGLNHVKVVATSGNGFEAGKYYALVIQGTATVDGVSVAGEKIGEFTISASAAAVDLANGTDGLGALKADTAATLVDTNELQADWTNGGRLDLLIDSTLADTNELQTDWVNGGRLDLIIDAILVDTGTTLDGRIPAALIGGRMDANLGAISGDVTAADVLEASMETLTVGTATGTPTTTTMEDSALTEATNDHYNGRIIAWRTGALAGQATNITAYNGTTKVLTFTAVTDAATAGDAYVIV